MKLNPDLINSLCAAAHEYGDDAFFGVRSAHNEFFVCNWTFGFGFYPGEILNCHHVASLEDETDRLCAESPKYKDIVRHIFTHGWRDILVGEGLHQQATLVRMLPDELHVFRKRGWPVIPFETDNRNRFYVREAYFDLAEQLLGDDLVPAIFRPVKTRDLRFAYRPLLLLDNDGDIRGMLSTISEENMRNPIDRTEVYRKEVERLAPEFM